MSAVRLALSIVVFAVAVPVHAAIHHLRVGAGCTYATIQAALEAERANPGSPADFIWIARNQAYTAQDIQIHDQNVFLYGGVDDCVDSSISGTTILSGSGGSAKSVMTISGHSQVWLGGLTISEGDNTASGVGGGINFVGTGFLKVGSSAITDNRAGYGGGINFNGTGGAGDVAELWINYDTLITHNAATTSGGGIRIEGNASMRVVDPQVWIAYNDAEGGYGGGIQVIGPARANIGSPGYQLIEYIALLYGNTAQYGGGLAVTAGSGDNQNGFALLFTTDATHPVWFDGNVAAHIGGAIYAHPNAGVGGGDASICGGDYRLSGNVAQEGSAVYADEQYDAITGYHGASVSLGPERIHATPACGAAEPPSSFGAVECTSPYCNLIDGNLAQNPSGQAVPGSTILVQSNASVDVDHTRVLDNHGAHVMRLVANDSASSVNPSNGYLSDSLVAGNVVDGDLVIADSQTRTKITNCTISGNQIGSAVVHSDGILDLFDDIVAQGQTTTLVYTGGNPNNLTIDYLLSMEVASLAQGSHVIHGDPAFVDVATGDYRLMATSLAIDVAPAVGGDDRDLDGRLHDQDIASVPNLDGVRDLGAYERQLRYCGAADTVFCATFDYD